MKNADRIWAVAGLVLIAASILCMLAGSFAGDAKGLLMNISLFALAGAGAILLLLGVKRRKEQADVHDDQKHAE